MSKYDGGSTEDLGNEFSDRYKDDAGFRPRHISFDDREAIIAGLESLDRSWELSNSTESGRDYLRSQGYHIDYQYGDRMTYRGTLYQVTFLYMNDGKIEAYDLQPMYVLGWPIKLSVRSLIAWTNEQRDRAAAKMYGVSYEEYTNRLR